MFVAALILILSSALFFFYFQMVCRKILRRRFEQEYYQFIVNANRLEFPYVRKTVEEFDEPIDHDRTRMMLKCDFLALTYLLKNAANLNQRYSRDERLLMAYFKTTFFSFLVRHWLGMRVKSTVLKLTSVLEYFANVVGERVNTVRFGNLTANDYLLNL